MWYQQNSCHLCSLDCSWFSSLFQFGTQDSAYCYITLHQQQVSKTPNVVHGIWNNDNSDDSVNKQTKTWHWIDWSILTSCCCLLISWKTSQRHTCKLVCRLLSIYSNKPLCSQTSRSQTKHIFLYSHKTHYPPALFEEHFTEDTIFTIK